MPRNRASALLSGITFNRKRSPTVYRAGGSHWSSCIAKKATIISVPAYTPDSTDSTRILTKVRQSLYGAVPGGGTLDVCVMLPTTTTGSGVATAGSGILAVAATMAVLTSGFEAAVSAGALMPTAGGALGR